MMLPEEDVSYIDFLIIYYLNNLFVFLAVFFILYFMNVHEFSGFRNVQNCLGVFRNVQECPGFFLPVFWIFWMV